MQQFSKLSEAEQHETHEALRQIAEAERRLAGVVLKHLNKSAEDLSVEISGARWRGTAAADGSANMVAVFRCGGQICGLYIDPPGVCIGT